MYGPISEFSLELTLWLQSFGEPFLGVMGFFTELGTQEFYMVLMAVYLWLIDYWLGVRLAVLVLSSAAINAVFKLFLHAPRPYWVDSQAKAGVWENTFGAPSGHAQTPIAAYGYLAAHYKKRWIIIGISIVIFLIGISRLALAAHFIEDTLLGWVLGAITLFLFIKYENKVSAWVSSKPAMTQYAIAFAVSIGLILLAQLTVSLTANWNMPQDWISLAEASPLADEEFRPNGLESVITPAGALFGGLVGIIWLKERTSFSPKGKPWQYIVRLLVGMIGLVGIWLGLDLLFPDNGDFISYALRFIRYALTALWATGLGPWVFIKTNLAKAN